MRILLVIPCLNESGRIEPFLASLKEALQGDSELRVLVVDDGSSKQEQRQLSDIVEKHRVGWGSLCSLHCLEVNRGKGGAVYAGWATAVDEQLLGFVDADGSCDAQSVKLLIDTARRQSAPCALFGSRVKMLGNQIERTWKRHLIGRFFAILVGSLLGIPVYDSQCGLKILHRSSYESVRLKLKLEGFAFDVVDYLLKPITFNRFFKATNKAKELHILKNQKTENSIQNLEPNYLFIKCESKYEKILIEEILFVPHR